MIPLVWIPYVALTCHLVGDYMLQSDWMAMKKNKKTWPCLIHVLIYTACFLVLTLSWKALLFIGITHFLFDRFPVLVRGPIWLKNHFPTGYPPWWLCDNTGYYDDSPYNTAKPSDYIVKRIEITYGKQRHKEITWWLSIINDNTLHLICNFIALTYLT